MVLCDFGPLLSDYQNKNCSLCVASGGGGGGGGTTSAEQFATMHQQYSETVCTSAADCAQSESLTAAASATAPFIHCQ